MPTPFPGMDPYLEHPDFWPGVHHRLITAIGDDLAAKLAPRYYVDVEERTVVALPGGGASHPRPDVTVVDSGLREAVAAYAPAGPVPVDVPEAVRLGYLQVRTAGEDRVVTMIDLLSPFNKRPGACRADYERKRLLLLARPVHLVEIDLLRAGEPMTLGGSVPRSDFRILVRPWESRPSADLFAFDVSQPIPRIAVPLLPGDDQVGLDVGALVHGVYDRGQYRLRIDYRQEPEPSLSAEAAAWADGLLRAAGLR